MEEQLQEEIPVSEFPSVRSKTSRTITLRQFVDIVRSDLYKATVQEHRRLKSLPGEEARAQALKNQLPCIVPAGVCQGGHAVKDLLQKSYMLCIDMDHTDARTHEVLQLVRQLSWVKVAFISVSGTGVKALVRVRPEDAEKNYAQLYAAVGNAVSAQVQHPYDAKCKILTQPCFYSWHPEAYYNAEADEFVPTEELAETDEPSSAAKAGEAQAVKTAAQTSADTLQPANAASAASTASGFLVQFLDDFERSYPFRRGSRNDIALKLGGRARGKGFSEIELQNLIALFVQRYAANDFTAEDIRKRVLSGYQHVEEEKKQENRAVRGQKGVKGAYRPPAASDEEENAESVLEKNEELRATVPTIPAEIYPQLPDFLQRCCKHASSEYERDLALLGSLNCCSALFPYVNFFYKSSRLSPHFYLAAVGSAGAGKGIVGFTSALLDPTQEYYDGLRRACKKEFEAAMLDWEEEVKSAMRAKRKPDLKLKPEEQKPQYFKISATTSKSRLIESLAAAGDVGCCMVTTEINTMISSIGQDYGKYEDILCKAAHHEEVSSSYKGDGEPIVARHPHLALSMAGTQEQFKGFFRSLEVGLYSRFAFYTRPQSIHWESCAPDSRQIDLRQYYYDLGREMLEKHKLLLQAPTLVSFSTEQWSEHTAYFSLLMKRALAEGRDSMGGIVHRMGLLCMRIAAILTMFRKSEDYPYAKEYRCTDTDFHTALCIAQTLAEHGFLLSTSLPDTDLPPSLMHPFHRMENVLSSLSRHFTYTEFVQKVMELGVSEATGKRLLKKAVDLQLVEKQKDGYAKKNRRRRGGV